MKKLITLILTTAIFLCSCVSSTHDYEITGQLEIGSTCMKWANSTMEYRTSKVLSADSIMYYKGREDAWVDMAKHVLSNSKQ